MSHSQNIEKTFGHRGALALVALAGFLGGVGAGCSSSGSQTDARDRATSTSCAWYSKCNQIGPGLMYDTLESCQVQVRGSWDKAWPVASCDGKINEPALETCLEAIASTTCGNGLDILNTLANKCPAAKVCSGAGATSPDGG
jgi:hypothetical protein